MSSFPVKFYHSEMENAPTVTNAFGSLTALFDALLINGFNTKTVDSITSSGAVATATIAAGHGYVVDQIVYISGVDQAEYGTEQRVVTVTPTTFTFAITGSPASPATTSTSITVKAAPQGGWEIVFSDTVGARSKRAYRSTSASSNKPILWMDDGQSGGTSDTANPLYNATYAKKAKVMICQDMYDINTPKGAYAPYNPLFPKRGMVATAGGASIVDGWMKWYYAKAESTTTTYDNSAPAAGNRKWTMICDDRTIYFFTQWSANYGKTFYSFGDFNSYRPNDAFNSYLMATTSYSGADSNWGNSYPWNSSNSVYSLDSTGKVILRDSHQNGIPVAFSPFSLNTYNGQMIPGYITAVPYPNPADYSMILHPVYMYQNTQTAVRGMHPGYYWVINNMTTTSYMLDNSIVDSVVNYSGKKFIICACGASTEPADGLGGVAHVAFDLTGPWW